MNDLRAAAELVAAAYAMGHRRRYAALDSAMPVLKAVLAAIPNEVDAPDFLDGARLEYRECMEVRRLLGYLWNATGENHLRPVHDLFADDDPIVADVERLAIFAAPTP